jgi:hypothetical protein
MFLDIYLSIFAALWRGISAGVWLGVWRFILSSSGITHGMTVMIPAGRWSTSLKMKFRSSRTPQRCKDEGIYIYMVICPYSSATGSDYILKSDLCADDRYVFSPCEICVKLPVHLGHSSTTALRTVSSWCCGAGRISALLYQIRSDQIRSLLLARACSLVQCGYYVHML